MSDKFVPDSEWDYTRDDGMELVRDTPHGVFRARIVRDESYDEPYDDGGCPIIRIQGYWVEMTSYGQSSGFDDGLPRPAHEIFGYFRDQLGSMQAIDTFERYLRIWHDGNIVEFNNDGVTYVAYVTRTLAESWGCQDIPKADISEWQAYVNGDVFGYVIEQASNFDDDEPTEWMELDSCFGFYGENYAKETAEEQLAYQIEHIAAEMLPVPCSAKGSHHSEDRVSVYRGKIEPDIFCGFHASQL